MTLAKKHKEIFAFSHKKKNISYGYSWSCSCMANEAILRKTHILKSYLYIIRKKKWKCSGKKGQMGGARVQRLGLKKRLGGWGGTGWELSNTGLHRRADPTTWLWTPPAASLLETEIISNVNCDSTALILQRPPLHAPCHIPRPS